MFCVRWNTWICFWIPVSSCHTNVSNCHFAVATRLTTFANVDFVLHFLLVVVIFTTADDDATDAAVFIISWGQLFHFEWRRTDEGCFMFALSWFIINSKNSNTIFVYMQFYTIKCFHCVSIVRTYADVMSRKYRKKRK